MLGTIQQAIAAQDDLSAAAREIKRSLTQRLFTYGPGAEPVPTKETEIGEVPEHWEMVRLEVIAPPQAAQALERMLARGSRLPRAGCQRRLQQRRT